VTGTLALGIAATTIAYGLATAVLWRPLPFQDADRLAFVWETADGAGQRELSRVTSARFAEWRDRSRSFTSLALFAAAGFSMNGTDGVTPIRGVRVSAGFFDTLGVSPALGRTFSATDEVPGQHQVLVLSHAFWQQRLGGRADVVGSSIRLNGLPYTVVGVMPPVAFPGWPANPATVTIDPSQRELWVPIPRTPQLDANSRSHVFGVVGRLAPGVSLAQATDELTRMASPSAGDAHGGTASPLREQFVRDARLPLLALVGAAAALLLVACANLAALQVAAFESRRAELAVRAAIGASARRLASQLSAESLLLAVAAGAAGILAARYALAVLPERLPPSLPFLTPASLDLRVAAFTALITIGAGLAMAAWPIVRLLRSGPAPRGAASGPRGPVFRVLVVAQVSVTIALAVSAALLVQSLWSVESEDPGFLIDGIVATDVDLPATLDTPAKIVAFEDRLRQSFEGRAGIRAVALAYDHPLEANWLDSFSLDGAAAGDNNAEIRGQAQLRIVSPGYFETLGVEVLAGRVFTEDHGPGRPGAAVVNEAFAAAHGGQIVGRRLRTAAPQLTWGASAPAEFEILGTVENERFRGLERPSEPAVYVSTRQFAQTGFVLLVRSATDTRAVAQEVRSGVRAIEPGATVGSPASLAGILGDQLVARRVTADVIGGFAGAALALAALGVYGVVAMLVASRTREIGVRLALGASPRGIFGRVLGESILNAAPGIAGGVVLAIVAGRLLEGFLVGVSGGDPLTLALVAGTMLGAAVLAALFPAVRAARVDPAIALRGE
jgi:predicted permease